MRYSEIGGLKSSKIILGTDGYGDIVSEREAFKLLDVYRENGGNHIDTAKLYCGGESETIVGRWIKSRGKGDCIIATKGAHPNLDTMHIPRLSRSEIESDIDESLKRLGIECIDLYWLHRDDESVNAGEVIESMNEFVKKGKISNFGCSNWKSSRVKTANDYAASHSLYGFCASQIRFSPASTAPNYSGDPTLVEMDGEEFEFYKNSKIPVVAFASQAKGFFSKFIDLGEQGLSAKARERYYSDENVKKAQYVKLLSDEHGVSPAAVVCASLVSVKMPCVFPIIGGKNVLQIEQSLGGADLVLSREEISKLIDFA